MLPLLLIFLFVFLVYIYWRPEQSPLARTLALWVWVIVRLIRLKRRLFRLRAK